MKKDNKSILQILTDISVHSRNAIFQCISKTLLDNLNNFSTFKIGALADISNVSISSVTRFCKFLGFSGFKDFYSHLEWELKLRSVEQKNTTEIKDEQKLPIVNQLLTNLDRLTSYQIESINSWLNNLNPILEMIKNSNTIYFFGIGKMSSILEAFMLDLTWESKKVVYSKDRDNQVHYSKNVNKGDLAIFLDELMLGESLNMMYKNVSEKTSKIIIFSKNAFIGNKNVIYHNPFWEEKYKNIFNVPFITIQLKILIEMLSSEVLKNDKKIWN